ncbi:hypothetical protein [Limoniibacter endophyticus]|uniref:Uncharacterized protein n=1 Tax=Limoniibacter endophyticus TaxID=1565040 RepID=A0A8J3GFB1_9HYPH|nr:hypothetical protein [Limoniibacter endophyticus]GHC61678.1 hypothetical protein GCM10010136_02370 [Limoniibacter endophyticus]
MANQAQQSAPFMVSAEAQLRELQIDYQVKSMRCSQLSQLNMALEARVKELEAELAELKPQEIVEAENGE